MPINAAPSRPQDLPAAIPIFPLSGALLLPRGEMPLNIFEPRYLAMIDDSLRSERVIGMIQPREAAGSTALYAVGCAGRVTAFSETGDGRILITLTGLSRFKVIEELSVLTPYRQAQVDFMAYSDDLDPSKGESAVDRDKLLATLRAYLVANDLSADWDSIDRAPNEALVNALSMMSPFSAREKQALLEARDLKARAETLVALTEIDLAGSGLDRDAPLQ